MARKKIEYSEQELNRQTNYIIVLGASGVGKQALERSIEVAEQMLLVDNRKKVIVLSQDYESDKFKKIPPTLVQTFDPGTLRLLSTTIDSDMNFVIERASSGLKNGLFIIDKDLADIESVRHLLEVKGKGQDYVVHRSKLGFLKPELEYIRDSLIEANKAIDNKQTYKPDKRIILRIHNDKGFSFSKENLVKMFHDYGQEHGFNIYLAYYLAALRTRNIEDFVMVQCAENEQTFSDFVNPNEWRKKTDNFIYYDWFSKKILGVDHEVIDRATNSIAKLFQNQA